jgi:hypothetical protein
VQKLVAAMAGGDDVAGRVRTAVLTGCDEFRGALKEPGLLEREAVLACEGFRIVQPHSEVTIETTTLLGRIGVGPMTGDGMGHGISRVELTVPSGEPEEALQ